MEDPIALDDETYKQLVSLAEEGDDLLAAHEIEKAMEKYRSALAILPDPKFQWELSTYIYAALGDAFFLDDKNEDALVSYQCAFNSAGGEENPYVCLMLGESWFELGETEKAREYLLRAYRIEGEAIFEDEEPKYFELIKEQI